MSIQVKGLDEVIKKLENLRDLKVKTKPLMNTIGNTLQNSIERSFEKERSPFGTKWKALKSSTIEQKKKAGKSDKILRRDGNLADKWLVESSNTKTTVFNHSEGKGGFKYGLTHQFGSPKMNVPARPFLPIDKNKNLPNDVKEIIKDEVVDFILNKLK